MKRHDRGRFQFVPRDPGAGAPIAASVEHLLLEGGWIPDESRRPPEDPAGAPGRTELGEPRGRDFRVQAA